MSNDMQVDWEIILASKITRRDFLNGIAVGTGASLLMPGQAIAQASGSLVSTKLSDRFKA